MDHEKIIDEYLYHRNGPTLENSKLTELQCDVPVEVEDAEWVSLDKISERTRVGYPLQFEAEKTRVLLTNNLHHGFCVSSTGKGKTNVIILNTAEIFSRYSDKIRPSMVIPDPKGELTSLLTPQLRDKYEIFILHLKDPAAGNVRVNPLSDAFISHHHKLELERSREKIDVKTDPETWMNIGDDINTEIRREERCLTDFAYSCNPHEPNAKEQCWNQGARVYNIGAAKVALYESEKTENQIGMDDFNPELIMNIVASTQDDYEYQKKLFKKYDDDPDIKKAYASPISLDAKQTRSSYESTLMVGLSKWSGSEMRRLTSKNNLDFEELVRGEKPFVLFIIADDLEPNKDELLKFTIERLLRACQDEADKQPDGRLRRGVVYLLDEFCNFPCMIHVARAVTVCRSRGMFFFFVVQSFQQMIDRYGENLTYSIFDSCDIQICLGCNSYSSKQRFAEQFGQKPHNAHSINISADGSYSRTISTTLVPVLKVSDIDQLRLGEFYLRFKGRGYKSFITPYFLRDGVNHVRQTLPRLNRCVEDYLPRTGYDIEKSVERDRAKRRRGYSRFDDLFGPFNHGPMEDEEKETDMDNLFGDNDIFKDGEVDATDTSSEGTDTPDKGEKTRSFDDLFESLIKNGK